MDVGNLKVSVWDLGGHEAVRRVWTDYYANVDAIIYVVDSADQERFEESKRVLNDLLSDPELERVPFAILGNKGDIKTSLKREQLIVALGLDLRTDNREIQLFSCSLVEHWGYTEAFKWLSDVL